MRPIKYILKSTPKWPKINNYSLVFFYITTKYNERITMKKPTRKSFYEYMSKRFDVNYRDRDGYATLLAIIKNASNSDEEFSNLVEIISMNNTDRLIYRNTLAEQGRELTPRQVNEYIAIIQYGLEHVS